MPVPARCLPPITIEEAKLLGRFVSEHGSDKESLISTPLLMHFATILETGLDKLRTVADLYDRVVDEALERDLCGQTSKVAGRRRYGTPPLADWYVAVNIVKVVMTRMALAILAPIRTAPG